MSAVGMPLSEIGQDLTCVGNATGAAQTMHAIGYNMTIESQTPAISQPAPQPVPAMAPGLQV